MKKLLIAALLVIAPTAFAQTANPTADTPTANPTANATAETPTANVTADTPTLAHEPAHNVDEPNANGRTDQPHVGANEDENVENPAATFNWAHDWFSFYGKDVYGGKLGDGKMVDEHGNVVMHQVEKEVIDPVTHEKKLVKELEPEEEEGMSPPFLFMLINFAILLIILAKGAGPAARKLAEERHDEIQSALTEAARLRDQAKARLADYETRIKDVDAEVKKLMEGIRADADADKARILEAASKQAAQMKRDAEARIAAEIEFARAQLRKEVAIAAAGATEKLLREKMTQDDQTKLVTTFIGNMQTPSSKEAR